MSFVPVTIDNIEEINISLSIREQYEIEIVRDGDDNIYHYTRHIDGIFEQLIESGDIEQ